MRKLGIVVMGPSGCGKSTVGARVADRLRVPFIEGDVLHLPSSIDKMSRGVSLTDSDRWPWIERVGREIASCAGTGSATSCSALKRTYRDRLRSVSGQTLAFVFLDVSRELLHERLKSRVGHYMRVDLLDSQIATLERPYPDEVACTLDGSLDAEVLATQALEFAATIP